MPTSPLAVTRLTRMVLFVVSGLTIVFMLYAGQPWKQESSSWPLMFGFAVWALSPYGGLALLSRHASGQRLPSWLVLVASLLSGSWAVVVQYQAFVAKPDPQSGLVYVFLPLYQWLVVGLLFVLSGWWGRSPSAPPIP
jgi:hypothetical protein